MKIKNLLHQPLELDFGKGEVIRINAREARDIDDKYASHEVFLRNSGELLVITKPKVVKEKATDVQPEK